MRIRLVITAMAALTMLGCSESGSNTPTSATAADDTALLQRWPMRHMLSQLELTAGQKEALKAVFEAHRAEVKELRSQANDSSSRAGLREERKALRTKIKAEVDAVLTGQQRNELEQLVAAFQAKRFQRPSDQELANRLDQRLEKLTAKLDLNSEQQRQVRALFEAMHAERRQGVDQPFDPEARLARREALLKQMQQILSADQYGKFQSLHSQAGGIMHGRGWRQSG